jgi:hypothetical protein
MVILLDYILSVYNLSVGANNPQEMFNETKVSFVDVGL